MPRRPTPKSLESLRVTLQKLEQTSAPGGGDVSMGELKRVLVNRIADLELTKTLVLAEAETDEAHEPSDLIPPQSRTGEGSHEMASDAIPIEKLD